jgi:hypothetical protein
VMTIHTFNESNDHTSDDHISDDRISDDY